MPAFGLSPLLFEDDCKSNALAASATCTTNNRDKSGAKRYFGALKCYAIRADRRITDAISYLLDN